MHRFSNILYYADGTTSSCAALERAVRLARVNQARLTVVDVLKEVDSTTDIEAVFGSDLNDILQERRREDLEKMLEGFQDLDEVFYTRVLTGLPFVEVIRLVQSGGYDLLIKEASPPRGLTERLFGSNDLHLLRKCPCPVWIDKPAARYPYRSVLAAVDPLGEDASNDRLIMDLASSLAQREKAQLAVVHAWELAGESLLLEGRSRVSENEVRQLLAAQEGRHRRALDELLADYDLSTNDDAVHLVKGEAASSITETTEKINADLVVMATVERRGIPGFFIGNTAEEVIQTIDASVLAVKPGGFISPVLP